MSTSEYDAQIHRDVRKVLERARTYIANPATWTQETLARDQNNEPVGVMSDAACKFCAVGAIRRALYIDLREHVSLYDWNLFSVLAVREGELARANDSDGRLVVLDVIDRPDYPGVSAVLP